MLLCSQTKHGYSSYRSIEQSLKTLNNSKNTSNPSSGTQKREIVLTPKETINNLFFEKGHIFEVDDSFKHPTLPTSEPWVKPSKIKILTVNPEEEMTTHTKVHYFVGGISALMQAAHKVMELGPSSKENVIYVWDGKVPKSILSGHQAHKHTTEWAVKDCRLQNLCKAMFQGMGIIKKTDPTDLENYSYIHFPIDYNEVIKNPLKFLKLYGCFFKQRLKYNFVAKNNVTKLDRWLCDTINSSLKRYKELNDKIEKKTGLPIFKYGERIYWSKSLEKLQDKERLWKEANIPCEMMSNRELNGRTLLDGNKNLHALKVYKDGHFLPETPQRVIEYFKDEYPNFSTRIARLKELDIDYNGDPICVVESDPETKKETKVPITTFFCSPGHSEVFVVDPNTKDEKRLYEEVPVTGITTLWRCTISLETIKERLDLPNATEEEILKFSQNFVASANLSNLHITPFSAEISEDGKSVALLIRGTQGANFNSTIAEIDDLHNMIANLNKYYIGDWELLSAGSCSRKTSVKNAPEVIDVPSFGSKGNNGVPNDNAQFLVNQGGVGYSFGAAKKDSLRHPRE